MLAALLVLVGVAIAMFRGLPAEFAPSADVGRVFISVDGPEGASLSCMDGYARRLEAIALAELAARGDIERLSMRVPGSFGDGSTGDVNSARVMLVSQDWHARRALPTRLRARFWQRRAI